MFSMISCSLEERLKNRIIHEIYNANGKDISIDLNKFSKEKILKMCIQSPYLTREAMEQRIGAKIDKFYEVDDKFFVLWIFKDRQTPIKIKFHRGYELDFGYMSKGCTATSLVNIINSQLYLNGGN